MISRTVKIKFSIVSESKKITSDQIIKEISEAFFNGDIIIPWIDKVEKISLKEI